MSTRLVPESGRAHFALNSLQPPALRAELAYVGLVSILLMSATCGLCLVDAVCFTAVFVL